ncbi:Oxidase/peroxidase, protein [Aphelenchoides besseyi]|nr:Oxidase/peroxidase, protein [Aphelenchoides besseyi]KAI6223897.1 Oxidase/peroxidase, protein [Aphelenchoides besseyi]
MNFSYDFGSDMFAILVFVLLFISIRSDEVDETFQRALNEVSHLYNHTEPELFSKYGESTTSSPANQVLVEFSTHMPYPRNAWLSHTFSSERGKQKAFSAYVLLRTTENLRRRKQSLSAIRKTDFSKSGICGKSLPPCSSTNYRSYDGSCNNVQSPTWGAAFAAFRREIAPDYSDEISDFRTSIINDYPLPNPRLLSNVFFDSSAAFDESQSTTQPLTTLFVHWAMFIFTDMVHIGSMQLIENGKHVPLPCCEADHPECRPITVDEHDPFYGGFVSCLDYPRSLIASRSDCSLGPREQSNQATSFLDASNIYGSTADRAVSLRTFQDGKLVDVTETTYYSGKMKVSSDTAYPKPMLMTVDSPSFLGPKCPDGMSCFLSGSEHTNFLPTLVSLHTLWIRQHNRVAQTLKDLNREWSDEQLYQEARRVVIAQIQHITYNEFLPLLIGRERWHRHIQNRDQSSDSDELYSLNVNPSVINGYAAAVGQFFYTMLGDKIAQFHSAGYKTMERPLGDYINKPKLFLFGEDIDGILRFLIRDSPPSFGLHMSADVRGRLFKGTSSMGLDLAAMLLQTGRDHGLPSYVVWREHCGGSAVDSFEALWDDFADPKRVIPLLKKHFRTVEDVDLLIGGLAERPIRGAAVGPTFACIIAKQFRNTKFGDRFWYENTIDPWGFSREQLTEIRKTTLAQVMCENSGMVLVQPHVFEAADKKDNFPLLCNGTQEAVEKQSFEPWRDVEAQIQMSVTMETVKKAIEIGVNVVNERRKREAENIRKNQGRFHKHDPIFSYGQMMRPKREAIEQSKLSSVLLEATRALMYNESLTTDSNELGIKLDHETLQQLLPQIDVSEFVSNIAPFMARDGTVEQCLPKDLPCDPTAPYRSYSGWCNNLRFPHYGNAFGPLRHLFPPEYADGIDAPRSRSVRGGELPLARSVSNAIHVDRAYDDEKYTHMVMQFGQFLDHEVTHSPVERGPSNEILNCSRCDSPQTLSVHCMPVHLPDNDPFHPTHDSNGERRCFPMARSLLGQLSLGYRNQLNQLTAYLDASVIYGSTQCEAAALRLFHGGLMNSTEIGSHNTEALPQGDQEQDCRSKPQFPCFVAGDERNSHQPGLTTMHNIWLREHNRLARELSSLNLKWSDERLYQEARRIVGAQFQHIVFNEYLPKLIGRRFAQKYELEPQRSGYFEGYDSTCDASISHPFATAAFRYGHTLMFPRLTSEYANHTKPVDLQENFNNMESIYDRESGGLDSILVGLLGSKCMAFDRHITDALRNHLFQQRGWPLSGFDLIALNIMRARDHGVQGYNTFRPFCGLRKARVFEDLLNEMDAESVAALSSVYEHVDDIDLFPGLLSEKPMGGALMPPTMACLIGEQFRRLKRCDRFYYENHMPETRFTSEQLMEIRKITLGSVLCKNGHRLKRIQPDVFSIPNDLNNAPIPCENIQQLNLENWKEKPVCTIGKTELQRGESKLRSPCVRCMCTANGLICRAVKVLDCSNLMSRFLLDDIKTDVSCVVQCAAHMRIKTNEEF